MLTRCEQCGTWFRVRAEHLEVAQGMVRCGRCGNLFNAHTTLVTDPPEVARASDGQTPARTETSEAPPSLLRDERHRIDSGKDQSAEPGIPSGPEDRNPEPRRPALATAPDSMLADGVPEADLDRTPPANLDPAVAPFAPGTVRAGTDEPSGPGRVPHRGRRWPWIAGSGLLALVIVAEITAIAAHQGTRRLVRTLMPRPLVRVQSGQARVRPTEIRVLSAEVRKSRQKPDALRVEGTLLNLTTRRLGLPELLVRFTNLDGAIVAEGLFGPGSYLTPPESHPVLPAHAGVAFRLRVVDPGRQAVGFSIRACRYSGRHRILCSTGG